MPGKPLQPDVEFADKARAHLSGANFICSSRVGFDLTCKHYARLERLDRDKHFSLFGL